MSNTTDVRKYWNYWSSTVSFGSKSKDMQQNGSKKIGFMLKKMTYSYI